MSAEIRFQELLARINETSPQADTALIEKAYTFACDAHGSQKRKDGSPYVTHPIEVAHILVDMLLDYESVAAALLHDTIEDTGYEYEDIKREFGTAIADLVEGVTKLTRVNFSTKQEQQMENLRKMFLAMSKDIRVIIIKIADRLHNMRTMEYHVDAKRREKSRETMEIYAPLAHRLGMQKVKWELEDLSLIYLDPAGYKEVADSLKAHGSDYDALLNGVESKLRERFDDANIEAHIEGRVKHIYSIYRKMYGQHKLLQEIYDLFAVRIIVETVADCYNVLGMVHDMYHSMPGRFKDYISMPKPNMYQSLHTTVLGREGTPFEVQIRTWDMHHTAEYGIAAHWKYKSGESAAASIDNKLEWVRRLIEHQDEADADAEGFISSIKVDMFADDVFVFTPKGDVINLPVGATVIDFAYAIHSAVGNRMVGAKVNGKQVNFENYRLQTGDIVEITTSNTREGPSRDWLDICKTNEARSKIRQWFKHERRDENIATGRERLESELKRSNIPLATVTKPEFMAHMLPKFSYPTLDDLMAAVGYGGISAARVVNRVRDELIKLHKLEQERAQLTELTVVKQVKSRDSKGDMGVIVAGLDNCLVKFSKCCNPIPGDQIIGFTTRGYGVSIHRADCHNVKPDDSGRWLDAQWTGKAAEEYCVPIRFVGRDRVGLLADVAMAMNDLRVNMAALKATQQQDTTVIDITVHVGSVDKLTAILNRLRRVAGCIDVQRA